MRKTLFKWLILILLMAYVTTVTIWANGEAGRAVCSGIEVIIESRTTADSITRNGVLDELSHYPHKIVGMPASQINTRAIVGYLNRLSNFEKVNCIISTDGRLSVRVVPMVPAIRVFDGDKSYYINKDGKRIASKANFFVEVPVVSGKFSESFTPRQVLPVSRFVETDPDLSKIIAMIVAEDANDIYLVPRMHGHIINFGDTTRLLEKKEALMAIYRKVMPYKGWDTYDTISVKFRGQVVASRRDKRGGNHGAIYDDDIDPDETTLNDLLDIGAE
ncbi:MAG: hypothetical protein K2M10_06215 [Muribaculaceae bacterium]|nr:hypothetical protein [Muribaculaceae bacterium]MDE6299220.1 hypothetical protein [Muribaculaceae bacterium]